MLPYYPYNSIGVTGSLPEKKAEASLTAESYQLAQDTSSISPTAIHRHGSNVSKSTLTMSVIRKDSTKADNFLEAIENLAETNDKVILKKGVTPSINEAK